MVQLHGALDYFVVKNNGKSIIILLDNHALENYCKYPAKNIDALLNDFLNSNDSTLLLEELYGDVEFKTLFDSKHLNVYDEFYNSNKDNDNIFAVDIRIMFENRILLDSFFDIKISRLSKKALYIKMIIDEARKKCQKFNEHYEKIKENYMLLKSHKTNNTSISNCLNLLYPFTSNMDFETFGSGLLEMYVIAHIIYSNKKHVICYLGAAHCATIFKLLTKIYGYEIKRNVEVLKIEKDIVSYRVFDVLNQMCIDFVD